MAEGADDSQKTEEPTDKKLAKAFEEGNIAKSQDLTVWISLAAGCMVVLMLGGWMATRLRIGLTPFIEGAHSFEFEGHALQLLMTRTLLLILSVVAIPFAILMLAGVMGNLVQHKPNFSTKNIQPKLSKLNPMKGFSRIFGSQGWINLGKAMVKLAATAIVVGIVVGPDLPQVLLLLQVDPGGLLPAIKGMVFKILAGILLITLALALADLVYQRHSHHKKLRMTRKEVADEHKDSDGDPLIKNKIRQIRREKFMHRMMENLQTATVVVMNPTHYAVALRYEEGESSAPICVAKGLNEVALRIRSIAEEHGVTVVENPPLARALYATVDLDEEVPEEHYKAVAEVIGFVYRLKAKKKPQQRPRPH